MPQRHVALSATGWSSAQTSTEPKETSGQPPRHRHRRTRVRRDRRPEIQLEAYDFAVTRQTDLHRRDAEIVSTQPPASRRLLASVLIGCLPVVAGCGFTANDLAGANDRRGAGYEVTLRVADAVNLADGAPVRIGGVLAGKVTSVDAEDYEAVVTMKIHDDVDLTDQAHARLRYTTALGEMYVQIEPSDLGAPLGEGGVLPSEQAETAPSVEDGLASASLLINGGGLGSIQTIVDELNSALSGRAPAVRSLTRELGTFLGAITAGQQDIDRTLAALAASSTTLNRRQKTIDRALTEIRPAAKTLDENTDDLVRLLNRAGQLGQTAKRIVDQTKSDVRVVVGELGGVLAEVNRSNKAILWALDAISLGAPVVDAITPGNFVNQYLITHLQPSELVGGGASLPAPDALTTGSGGLLSLLLP